MNDLTPQMLLLLLLSALFGLCIGWVWYKRQFNKKIEAHKQRYYMKLQETDKNHKLEVCDLIDSNKTLQTEVNRLATSLKETSDALLKESNKRLLAQNEIKKLMVSIIGVRSHTQRKKRDRKQNREEPANTANKFLRVRSVNEQSTAQTEESKKEQEDHTPRSNDTQGSLSKPIESAKFLWNKVRGRNDLENG